MNNKITNEHIKDVYAKFKKYYEENENKFLEFKQKHIVEEVKKIVDFENKFVWNNASLTDYINTLVYMIKGEKFARTINKFSEEYFIEHLCNDFNISICKNAKKSLELHKEYYKSIINKEITKTMTKEESKNTLDIKNIILYGAPGVGKTHNYKNLISMIEDGKNQKDIFDTISKNEEVSLENKTFQTIKNEKRVEFVTFHQSYSYEDFIEGFRPNESGNIELKDGIFKNIVKDALNDDENSYYIVIDEINRGNISKIFGELITLIEEDKRDAYEVTLPYSKEKFKVPSNLYIIATMNSTDKSIATIDIALRRRFTFLKMQPNENLIDNVDAKKLFNDLNTFIADNLSEDYKLGHSYFMKVENEENLEFVKEYKIKPLLEEYFYADDKNYEEALKILNYEEKKVDNE